MSFTILEKDQDLPGSQPTLAREYKLWEATFNTGKAPTREDLIHAFFAGVNVASEHQVLDPDCMDEVRNQLGDFIRSTILYPVATKEQYVDESV